MAHISVVINSQDRLSVDIDVETATLADLKTLLAERIQIPVEHQIVKFVGAVLDADDQTLNSYRIISRCTVRVEDARQDELAVTLERLAGVDPLSLTMSRSRSTVADLKRKIEEVEGIPLVNVVIRRDGVGCSNDAYLSRYMRDNVVDLQLEIRIDVHVTVYTGDAITVNVSSHEKVSVLQNQVYQRLRVPHSHQDFFYNNQAMNLEDQINQFGVTDGATIEVRLRLYEMRIFLKTLTGQTIILTVNSFDTVLDVKRKVEMKEGIPIDRQRIIFTGIQLNNNERFLAHRIEHESAVHLVLRYGNSFEITVIGPSGRIRTIEVAPQEVVRHIKTKMRELESVAIDLQKLYFGEQLLENDDATMEECGIVSGSNLALQVDGSRNTQIFVSLPDRQTISLWVDPDYTVAQLKEIIASRHNIPEDVQEIFFARAKLDDDRTLRSYVIETNHMLHVEIASPPVLQITIKFQNDNGEDLELEVPENQTVDRVKRAVLSKRGFILAHQQLFFNGLELENRRRLCDCEVTTGSSLDLILTSDDLTSCSTSTMHLFVKTLTGKTITLETCSTDTVLELKQQILEKEGVAIDSQCLILAGKQMENQQTVSDCGIQNQSVIHLVLRVPSRDAIQLVIQDLATSGNNITIDANLDDSVHDLKRRIEEREGITVPLRQLLYRGRVLVDEDSLSSCGIADGFTLQLIR